RDIFIFGSAKLSSTLIRHHQIDEYRLGLAPIVLGSGTPLFKASSEMMKLKLIEAKPLKSGGVLLRYESEGTRGRIGRVGQESRPWGQRQRIFSPDRRSRGARKRPPRPQWPAENRESEGFLGPCDRGGNRPVRTRRMDIPRPAPPSSDRTCRVFARESAVHSARGHPHRAPRRPRFSDRPRRLRTGRARPTEPLPRAPAACGRRRPGGLAEVW